MNKNIKNKPEFMLPFAGESIQDNEVTDEKTKQRIREYIEKLVQHTYRFTTN